MTLSDSSADAKKCPGEIQKKPQSSQINTGGVLNDLEKSAEKSMCFRLQPYAQHA